MNICQGDLFDGTFMITLNTQLNEKAKGKKKQANNNKRTHIIKEDRLEHHIDIERLSGSVYTTHKG